MVTRIVQGFICHNISSGSAPGCSKQTVLLPALVVLYSLTSLSCASVTLCGGIRGRFVCDDENPAVFHICMGNNQYTMLCPGTLHFNVRTQICDWPESANCVLENQFQEISSTTSPTTKEIEKFQSSVTDSDLFHASFTNKSASYLQNTVSVPKDVKHSESRHPRYRLKIVHNKDKDVGSLMPSDEDVIAQVRSLSDKLKTIDNYMEELESDRVGYMIEPYKANTLHKIGRYSKWYRPSKPTATSRSPYKKPVTSTARSYSTSPFSPSGYHRKLYRPRPQVGREWTSNPRYSHAKFPPARVLLPTEKKKHPAVYSAWVNSPAAWDVNKKTSYFEKGSNTIAEKAANPSDSRNIIEKDTFSNSVNTPRRAPDSSTVTSNTAKTRSSGSIFNPPPHLAPSHRHRNTHSFTRKFKSGLRHHKPAHWSHQTARAQTAKTETLSKKEETEADSGTPTTFQYTGRNAFSPKPTQQQSHGKVLTPRTADPVPTVRPTVGTRPWWSTTRKNMISSPTPAANIRADKHISTNRRFFQSTDTQEVRPVVRIPTRMKPTSRAVYHLTTPSASSKWRSPPSLEKDSVQSKSKPRRRNRPRYKPRHRIPKPNYYTRRPTDNFRLVPNHERASSYMSSLNKDDSQNDRDKRPINAPAAADRRFVLHGNFVKNYNKHQGTQAVDRDFALHKSQSFGHGSINAPASLDKKFALHKKYGGLAQDKVEPPKAGDARDGSDKKSSGKKITAYKSPVDKYKRKKGKCSESWCKLPDCRCIGSDVPGGFDPKEIPQMVLLTFDDSINFQNMRYYREIFNGSLRNPNGCPIKSTFFVSGDNSNYDMVRKIYKQGHEIASHTLSHRNPTTWWAHAGYDNWQHEVVGMRERLHKKAGVPIEEITGMRAPFLQVGGDDQFAMLKENKFRYDSSMVTGNLYVNKQPPLWPFTLDTPPDSKTCSLTPCPTRSYPGLWEVPLIRWYGSNKMACAMPDACTIGLGTKGSRKFIEENFMRHYTTNRAPLGIFIHASWFARKDGNLEGLYEFLASLADKEDVWVITVNQALDWIQRPVRLSALHALPTWAC